jgi:hypothetical protein
MAVEETLLFYLYSEIACLDKLHGKVFWGNFSHNFQPMSPGCYHSNNLKLFSP